VIGRVKLDEIAAIALGVECFQLRRILVGLAPELEHVGAAPMLAEGGERGRVALAAVPRNGAAQWLVAGVEIDVHIGRRLIEKLVGTRLSSHVGSHGAPPRDHGILA